MPIPIPMARNRYPSSSGSLIGVRKRMIDSAPTSPSESVSDEPTIVMTSSVVVAIITKFRANFRLLDSTCANRR